MLIVTFHFALFCHSMAFEQYFVQRIFFAAATKNQQQLERLCSSRWVQLKAFYTSLEIVLIFPF